MIVRGQGPSTSTTGTVRDSGRPATRFLIGTSGWNYPHWRERWYPRTLAAGAWLASYARHFPTVEVNYSFYRLPQSTQFAAWRQAVPGSFTFAVKARFLFATFFWRRKTSRRPSVPVRTADTIALATLGGWLIVTNSFDTLAHEAVHFVCETVREGSSTMAVTARVLRGSGSAVIRVKPLRQWFSLSQEAFAKALGVGRATIARWEASDSGPSANTAEGRLLTAMMDSRNLALKMFGPRHAKAWFDDPAPTFHDTPRATLVKRGPIPVRDLLREAWEGTY